MDDAHASRTPLSPTAAISAAWRAFTANPWLSIGVMLLLILILCVGEVIPFVNVVFMLFVSPAIYAGGAWFFLRGMRGEKPTLETAFESFQRWPAVTGAVLLMAAVSFLLMIPLLGVMIATFGVAAFTETSHGHYDQLSTKLFAIPVLVTMALTYPFLIWWSARSFMVVFTVMEADRPGPVEAIKRAFAVSKGSVWRLLGLYLLCIPVILLGCLALCVGIVPAMVVMYYAFAYAYDHLKARTS